MDARLQQILDNAKHPIAKAILQGLFEDENFKRYMCQRVEPLVARKRAKLGFDMTRECWTWGEDDELEEGVASAIGNFFKHAATQSLATGLGVSASSLHKFGRDLTSRPKRVVTPAKATPQKQTKSVQHTTKPAVASPIPTVMPQDVHS